MLPARFSMDTVASMLNRGVTLKQLQAAKEQGRALTEEELGALDAFEASIQTLPGPAAAAIRQSLAGLRPTPPPSVAGEQTPSAPVAAVPVEGLTRALEEAVYRGMRRALREYAALAERDDRTH